MLIEFTILMNVQNWFVENIFTSVWLSKKPARGTLIPYNLFTDFVFDKIRYK